MELPSSSASSLLLVFLNLPLLFTSPHNAYSFPQYSITILKFSSLLPSMTLLSFDGLYSTANQLQPKHIDPLFPFEILQIFSSSLYSPPIIGYTSFVVGFPNHCYQKSICNIFPFFSYS